MRDSPALGYMKAVMKSLLGVVIWPALFLCLSGAGQVPPGKEKESIELCNGLLARQTVEQLAVEARGIEEPGKRIEVLTRVADYLWVQDEPSARRHLAEAYRTAENSLSGVEEEGAARKQDHRFSSSS